MSKARSTGNISNVIKTSTTCVTVTDGTTDLLIMSGSGRVTIPGDLVVLGGIAGSSAESASYSLSSSFATNANLLDGIDGASFLQTGSFNTFSSSIDTTIKNKLNGDGVISGSVQVDITNTTGYSTFSSSLSSSIGSLSGSVATTTSGLSSSIGSLSSSVATTTSGLAGRITTIEGRGATTGSNVFIGDQIITGSICSNGNIVTTGQIVAQTINVQQVTSSIVYSCGSNIFGNSLTNTQQFTGSMLITGSNMTANVGTACFQGTVCASSFVGGIVNGSGFCVSGGIIGNNSNNLYLSSNSSAGEISFWGNQLNTRLMTLTGCSNLGIGVFDPDIFGRGDQRNVGISVAGVSDNMALQLNAGGSAGRGSQLYMGQGGTRHFTISSNATESTIGTTSNTPLRFVTCDSLERFRITNTGIAVFSCRVCVPSLTATGTITTTASPGTYEANLTYLGTTYNFGPSEVTDTVDFKICGASASTTGNGFGFWTQPGNTTPSQRLRIDKNGIACFACQVCTAGLITSGNINVNSDGIRIERTTSGEPYLFFVKSGVTRASIYGGNNTNGLRFFMGDDSLPLTISPTGLTVDGYVLIGTDKGVRFDTSGASGHPELSIDSNAALNFKNTSGINSLTIANSGVSCFVSTVCALSLTTSNVVRSGDSALLRGSNVSQVGNNITFDAFRFLNPTGGVGGAASSLNGILYMSFSDTFTGGNQVSYQYLIITTGNGVSPGPFCFAQLYCGPLRGTNPISSISLVNDGGGGAVKVQATTAASGVSGANAYISFVGTAV